jgi:biopolymer transport protein ExbD
MIRLIDVVLIILFGIMMITSIDDQFEVRLVQTANLLPMPEETRGYVMVGLAENSEFLFNYGKVVLNGRDKARMVDLVRREKETIIAENRRLGGEQAKMEPQVRIWADSTARCGDVRLLMDVCKEADIACGLLTVKEVDDE